MKTLKELRSTIDFKLSSTDLYFSRIKDLPKLKLDLEVWLPTRNCNLQREKVWTIQQKRELIMSVFVERAIPPVCIMSLIDKDEKNSLGNDIKQVIDGKQRLTTFMDFLAG